MSVREMPGNVFGQYEVEVEGRTYQLYNLSAMAQLRVARLLGPTLLDLFKDGGARILGAAQDLKLDGANLTEKLKGLNPILTPIVEALHGLSDSDMDGIAKSVLGGKGKGSGRTPKVKLDNRWVDAWDWAENEPADKDLTGVGLIRLIAASLMREFSRIRDRHLSDASNAA